jgi:MFS family permease
VFCLFGYRATFAILKVPMAADLQWTAAQVTLGFSLMMVCYALTAFASGLLLEKWGPRPAYAIAGLCGGLGFYLTSLIDNHWAYLITFGLLGGIATGMLWVTTTVSVRQWYVGNTYATRWGFAFAGAPLAQWVLAEVTKFSLQGGGPEAWRETMQLLAVIIFGLLLVAVLLARKHPAAYGLKAIGELASTDSSAAVAWRLREAYSTYAIWAVIFTFLTSMMAEFLIWTQVVSYWIEDKGWSQEAAIDVYKLIGIVGIATMPLLGWLADAVVGRVGLEAKGRKIMLIAGPTIGVLACLLLLACTAQVTAAAYLAAVLFAVYWAIVPGGVVGYTGAVYGPQTLARIWGLATLIVMGIGPFLGSLLGGWLKDLTGSYQYSLYYALGSFLVSLLLACSLPLTVKLPRVP